MRPAQIDREPIYLRSWEDIPNGKTLQRMVVNECNQHSKRMFGYHFVRMGALSASIELPDCPVNHIVNIGKGNHHQWDLYGDPQQLPLTENCVDAFLLAFELDFSSDPHQVLREIDRTITPNGYVTIVGFNPFTIDFLLRHVMGTRFKMLRQARYFSRARICDWLQLLDFEIIDSRFIGRFSLTMGSKKAFNRTRFFQWIASRVGCSYMIVARKREIPLTLVKPKWRSKPRFSAVNASARTQL